MDAVADLGLAFARLEDVVVRRGKQATLRNVSLDFRPATITLLLGPNGAGKSTLLHTLCGAIVPISGSARVGGQDPRRARRGPTRIGLVPQEVALYGRLTVQENIEVFAALLGWTCPTAMLARVLRMTWLVDVADRRVSTLSGGLQRRVNLACALAGDPHLLLLDEPTVGLDMQARQATAAVLRAWAAECGTTIVVASHDIDDLETAADRVVVLRDGAVAAAGTPAALVREAFRPGDKRVDLLLSDLPDAAVVDTLARRGFRELDDRTLWRGMLPLADDGHMPDLAIPRDLVREIRVRRPGLADAFAAIVEGHRA